MDVHPERNVASIAAKSLLNALGNPCGLELELFKTILPGSGIGSSAASAATTSACSTSACRARRATSAARGAAGRRRACAGRRRPPPPQTSSLPGASSTASSSTRRGQVAARVSRRCRPGHSRCRTSPTRTNSRRPTTYATKQRPRTSRSCRQGGLRHVLDQPCQGLGGPTDHQCVRSQRKPQISAGQAI